MDFSAQKKRVWDGNREGQGWRHHTDLGWADPGGKKTLDATLNLSQR